TLQSYARLADSPRVLQQLPSDHVSYRLPAGCTEGNLSLTPLDRSSIAGGPDASHRLALRCNCRAAQPPFLFCPADALANTRPPMQIVLAYSGGLDTSVIVKWLKEAYDAEIITFSADIGQEEELKGLSQKARKTGATRHHTLDLVEEFARDFIYPVIRANAVYEGQYYLGTSIARPLIAKAQVAIAKQEHADTVAHGATGKGNDQCRFEFTYLALAPELAIISPWKIDAFRQEFPGRAE